MTQPAVALTDQPDLVEAPGQPLRHRSRRLATSTGATLALAAVAVTGTGGVAHADEQYTVRDGDTVTQIAKRYGTTVAAVRSANNLGQDAFIRAGQTLTIPTGTSSAASTATATTRSGSHTVAAGDTVWSIAQKHGTTVQAIVSANSLGADALIREGQTLTVPGATTTATTSTATSSGTTSSSSSNLVGGTFLGRSYPATVVASANANKATLLSIGVPSKAEMQAKVASIASQMGVDPSLAQAIAFQESGFDHSSVSPANAIGVMQVIPSSGEWASRLVGRNLNLLDPDDNVVAGVAILRQLLASSSDTSTAIASYYQGQGSVRANGMFSDTRRYVANVQTLTARF